MASLHILILLTFVYLCTSAPLEKNQKQQQFQRSEIDPELTAGYFEGDIVLDTTRNGLKNESKRWPNALVYYKINDHFDSAHVNHILRGLEIIESVSCIRFQKANALTKYYVNVTGLSGGCYSEVGFKNKPQPLNLQIYPLDEGCFRLGTIIHEFLHALGFYHMQSASDRDDYVHIIDENIKEGTESNFNKYNDSIVDNFDTEYDYASVLHYSAFAFSKNGKKTIVALKEGEEADQMGQRLGMTKKDINKLNTMYRCLLRN